MDRGLITPSQAEQCARWHQGMAGLDRNCWAKGKEGGLPGLPSSTCSVEQSNFQDYYAVWPTGLWRLDIPKRMWWSGEAVGLPGRLSGMGRWHMLAFVCQQTPAPWQEILEREEPRDTFLQGQRFPQHRNILAIKLNILQEEESSWKWNYLITLNNCLDFFHPFLWKSV